MESRTHISHYLTTTHNTNFPTSCRSCTSFASWAALTKSESSKPTNTTAPPSATATSLTQEAPDCPPDVEALGRSTWTLLHTIAANYPSTPSLVQQSETRSFISLFGKIYPCWVCADDFRAWMTIHEPRVSSRDEFGTWMCEAHNAVNEKLGKKTFDCKTWEERWKTGWRDGRCG